FRVGERHDAFETELAIPELDHFGHVVPVHGSVKHLGEIASDRHRSAAHVDMLVQLRQRKFFVRRVFDSPVWLDGELKHYAKRQPERDREAGAQVTLAIAPVILSTVSIMTSM